MLNFETVASNIQRDGGSRAKIFAKVLGHGLNHNILRSSNTSTHRTLQNNFLKYSIIYKL
ncbi:hypothetical protein QTP88_007702 [Uroleucon formosanum]